MYLQHPARSLITNSTITQERISYIPRYRKTLIIQPVFHYFPFEVKTKQKQKKNEQKTLKQIN